MLLCSPGATAFLRSHLGSRAQHLYVSLAGSAAALDATALAEPGLTYCLLLTSRYSLLTTYYLLLTAHYSLLTTYY